MANFRLVDRDTSYLLPPSVDEWLPDDHLARFVVEITDQLDISAIERQYTGSGPGAYHPRMLLALLFYSYATGTFSSRKIETASFESVPTRYVAGNQHPDHDTICTFRRRFLAPIGELFTQILLIAAQMDMVELGDISIDGTKVKANASKHKAMSWERAEARYEAEQAQHEQKMAARAENQERTGQTIRGRQPQPPDPGPRDKDQVNFTDPESRIMPTSNGWQQAWNAQAAVDMDSHLIVGGHLSQAPNDKQQLQPALDTVDALPDPIGHPENITADNGYYSEENVNEAAGEWNLVQCGYNLKRMHALAG